ncbi:hypothetical protein D3C76_1110870 [compost metagenome]
MIGTNGPLLKSELKDGWNMTVVVCFFTFRELVDGWRRKGHNVKKIGYAMTVLNIFSKSFFEIRIAYTRRPVCIQVG